MKKVKNLDELEKMVGREYVEKCFTEYMLSVIGQAKRAEDLQNGCAVMDEEELEDFVCRIGSRELSDEIKKHPGKEPVYFRAVKAALMALGYDEAWVSGEAADALNRKYL